MDVLAEVESSKKKVRGDTPLTQSESSSSPAQAVDSEGMKEVTKGVKDVELKDKEKKQQKTVGDIHPETVPLPEEVAGELDSSSIASTPPPGQDEEGEDEKDAVTTDTDVKAEVKEGQNQSDDDETKVGDVAEAAASVEVSKEPSKEPVTEVSADATTAQDADPKN
ncbi:hypothetical protein E1B28_006624 [Marasmius oreades]|uniref:Uncharacterized protein n=1 Tax=Marasmius oreades TaxID=181124 RepID=A0A9P8AAX2_9AGAR|nr:uncharacterized protein E1B28_006624 [Marasmius oreades]KAG7095940.1 hypothetical protein E1B28_006624 [Marasmius oreades]